MREEFVIRALGKAQSFAELCREFQISRKTGYKWLGRYEDTGLSGLVDESRRPDSSPTKVDDELVGAVVALRREFPTWGPKKLRVLLLRRRPMVEPPSEGTIARLLRENGFVRQRRQRRVSAGHQIRPPRLDPVEPNDVWTVDFKGWWRTRDGVRCEPLTVRDALSRYVLGARVLGSITTEHVAPAFELLFDMYGLPKTIQSDNGPPFASRRGIGGLSQLSAWWVSLGINVVRSRPGCPQDNGGHERMHGDMLALQHASAPTPREQQRLLDEWLTTFNHVRPHEALNMRTPAQVYRPSPRRRSHQRLGGFPDDCVLVPVKQCSAAWEGQRIHIGRAFEGYPVGFRTLDQERIEVWFFHMRLGAFRPGTRDTFEVDADLVAPPPAAKRTVPAESAPALRVATGTVARRASAVSLLELSARAINVAIAATFAALLGDTSGRAEPASEVLAGLDAGSESVTPIDSPCYPEEPGVTSVATEPGNSDGSHVSPPVEVTGGDTVEVTAVTGGGDASGLHERSQTADDRDRSSLRLRPPTIPAGWPWIAEASLSSRQKKTTNKPPRTTR